MSLSPLVSSVWSPGQTVCVPFRPFQRDFFLSLVIKTTTEKSVCEFSCHSELVSVYVIVILVFLWEEGNLGSFHSAILPPPISLL